MQHTNKKPTLNNCLQFSFGLCQKLLYLFPTNEEIIYTCCLFSFTLHSITNPLQSSFIQHHLSLKLLWKKVTNYIWTRTSETLSFFASIFKLKCFSSTLCDHSFLFPFSSFDPSVLRVLHEFILGYILCLHFMTPPSNLIHNLGLNLHPKMPKSISLVQIRPIAPEI